MSCALHETGRRRAFLRLLGRSALGAGLAGIAAAALRAGRPGVGVAACPIPVDCLACRLRSDCPRPEIRDRLASEGVHHAG